LEQATTNLAEHENIVYLAEHPANSLYYVGSALLFRTVFSMIADSAKDTTGLTHEQRSAEGVNITTLDTEEVNWHMHLLALWIDKEPVGQNSRKIHGKR
jgi:hypothetical protein